MADNLQSIEKLMDSYDSERSRLAETQKLVNKWEPTGLLEGLEDTNKQHGMAVLLENQARQLIDESSKTGTASNSEEWSGVALPLVRRIFGELAAQDFVSVQPMNLPSGLIFYLDFKYGTTQTAQHSKGSYIHGNTSASNADAAGGLYGAGRFGYSINDQTSPGIPSGSITRTSASWADVEFEPSLSSSVAVAGTLANRIFKMRIAKTQLNSGSNVDWEGARAFAISGSNITATYPAYTTTDSTYIYFYVRGAGSSGANGKMSWVKFHKQPGDTSRGDFEQSTFTTPSPNSADDVDIPEIDIALRSVSIVAKTRKLKAIWTPELAQDLNAYHSVDAEAELTSMLSEYISMEIDLEILDMLKQNADAKTEYWSAKTGFEYDSASSVFTEVSGNSNAYTKGEWFQTLGNKLQAVSNTIHQKTLRGGANFMVVSPETATVIESIPGYASDSDGDSSNTSYAMGVQKVGALNNRFTVYKNPYMLENDILLGFRGSNFLETGAVYAPYVPLIMTPLVYDPVNFTPRKGVMTRYAKKMVRPEFYGKVIVADINYV
jgi:hypothetical protein